MSYEIKWENIKKEQLTNMRQMLGLNTTESFKMFMQEVEGYSKGQMLALFNHWTTNRILASSTVSPREIINEFSDGLAKKGGDVTIDYDFIKWATEQGLVLEEEYYNDDYLADDYFTYTPGWITNKGYYKLTCVFQDVMVTVEAVGSRNENKTAILCRINGKAPFNQIGDILRGIITSFTDLTVIDDRPPILYEFTKLREKDLYFMTEVTSKHKRPYVEINELIEKSLKSLETAKKEDEGARGLYLYQLHSLLDHFLDIYLYRIRTKASFFPTDVMSKVEKPSSTFGPKIDLLHHVIGVLNGQEYLFVERANKIRNELYHAELAREVQIIDYNQWFDLEDIRMLTPVPRPTDISLFIEGVQSLLRGVGYQSYLAPNKSQHYPRIVSEQKGIYENTAYLKERVVKEFLLSHVNRYYAITMKTNVCSSCGMRLVGVEIKHCLFCCPSCKQQSSKLMLTYTCCCSISHPIYYFYSMLFLDLEQMVAQLTNKGEYYSAILFNKLYIELMIAAYWLQNKSYFDVITYVKDFGIAVNVPHKEVFQDVKLVNATNVQSYRLFGDMNKESKLHDLKRNPPTYIVVEEITTFVGHCKTMLGY